MAKPKEIRKSGQCGLNNCIPQRTTELTLEVPVLRVSDRQLPDGEGECSAL